MTYDKYFGLDSDQISQHCDLEKNDKCLYLGEYLSNSGFRGSITNKDILNLKKSPLDKTKRGYEYKAKAINKFASQINSIFEQKKRLQINILGFQFLHLKQKIMKSMMIGC
jgi:hypothetical protein